MKHLLIFVLAKFFVIGQAAVWAQIDQLPPEAGQTADKLIGLLTKTINVDPR